MLRQLLLWLKKRSWYCGVSDEFIMKLKTKMSKMHQLVLLTIKMTQATLHTTVTHSSPHSLPPPDTRTGACARAHTHTPIKVILLKICQIHYDTYYLIKNNDSNNRMIRRVLMIICDMISFVIFWYGIWIHFIIRMPLQDHFCFSAAKLYGKCHISASWHMLDLLLNK